LGDTRAVAEVVRTPIGPGARLPTRRALDERIYVRWPWLYVAQVRALLNRLPPRSRLRRALLRRALLLGWAGWARMDLEPMLVRYAPNVHWEPLPEMVAAGMRSSYDGHAGMRELSADWREAWERMDFTPQEVVDAGETIAVLGYLRVRARSGIEFDTPFGQVLWLEGGLVVREHDIADWDEALRAAGIPTAA